ncbi:MAG: nucleoside phosphorylase [Saprospiraceae bacterium]
MSHPIAASELVLNPDGSIYHCKLLPENLADFIFLVGDPGRVPIVSSFFDQVDFKVQNREIVTHTGLKNGKRVSVISTGMGTDNIDIVLSELDAVANIDLKTKQIKSAHKQLTFIRLGTSGSLQEDIPPDSYIMSTHGLGFDGLVHYYANSDTLTNHPFIEKFITDLQWNERLPRPYLAEADTELLNKAVNLGFYSGVTATATGFFGPQGRVLRLGIKDVTLNEKLSRFRFENMRITNFEMETSGIYGLSKLMGHRALTINCVVANRFTGQFSKDYHKAMQQLIARVMEGFL